MTNTDSTSRVDAKPTEKDPLVRNLKEILVEIKNPSLDAKAREDLYQKASSVLDNIQETLQTSLKLPFALNDTVWYLDDTTPFDEMPVEGRISGFQITWCNTLVIRITTNFNENGCLAGRQNDLEAVLKDFGKTVFFRKEDADAALATLIAAETNKNG